MGLTRRSCGNSGSTAAASMAGRGLGVLLSLRRTANLEVCFSCCAFHVRQERGFWVFTSAHEIKKEFSLRVLNNLWHLPAELENIKMKQP
ncbi:unnamed protein product [Urochloa humidicola]